MALKTLGTNATTSLSAIQYSPVPSVMSDADLAAFNAKIKPNYLPTQKDTGGANSGKLGVYLTRDGQFNIPERGFLKIYPGDWACVDNTTGWAFVLSQSAVTNGPYTHT